MAKDFNNSASLLESKLYEAFDTFDSAKLVSGINAAEGLLVEGAVAVGDGQWANFVRVEGLSSTLAATGAANPDLDDMRDFGAGTSSLDPTVPTAFQTPQGNENVLARNVDLQSFEPLDIALNRSVSANALQSGSGLDPIGLGPVLPVNITVELPPIADILPDSQAGEDDRSVAEDVGADGDLGSGDAAESADGTAQSAASDADAGANEEPSEPAAEPADPVELGPGDATENLEALSESVAEVADGLEAAVDDILGESGLVEELIEPVEQVDLAQTPVEDIAAPIADIVDEADAAIVDPIEDAIDAANEDLEEALAPIEDVLDQIVDEIGEPAVEAVGAVADDVVEEVSNGVADVVDGLTVGPGSDETDTDLTVDAGPVDIDVPLDPVEALVGDIDIGVDLDPVVDPVAEVIEPVVADAVDTLDDGVTELADTAEEALAPVEDVLDQIVDEIGEPAVEAVGAVADDVVEEVSNGVADVVDGLTVGPGSDETDTDLTVDAGPVDIDVPLDPVEALVGDIDIGIDLDPVVDPVAEVIEPAVADAVDTLDDGVTELADTAEEALVPIEDVLDQIVDEIGDPAVEADTDLTVDAGIAGTPVVDVDVPLDPVEALVGDIDIGVGADLAPAGDEILTAEADATIAALDPVADGLAEALSPQGETPAEDPAPADTDLTVDAGIAGTPVVDVDVPLDPVEALVGDIDIGVGADLAPAGDEILTAEADATIAALDPVADGLAEALSPQGETPAEDPAPADTDLTVDAGIAGTPVVDVDVPLDPVEALVGDIDIGVDAGIDQTVTLDADVMVADVDLVAAEGSVALGDALDTASATGTGTQTGTMTLSDLLDLSEPTPDNGLQPSMDDALLNAIETDATVDVFGNDLAAMDTTPVADSSTADPAIMLDVAVGL